MLKNIENKTRVMIAESFFFYLQHISGSVVTSMYLHCRFAVDSL